MAGLLVGVSFGWVAQTAHAQYPIGNGVARQATPPARLSPLQERHRQAYYQAIQAGYAPEQARAYADSVVQPPRPAAPQPHPMAASRGGYPQPGSMPQPGFDQQRWEQHRIAQQQQMAAAQQNARLWQALQQQRGVQRPGTAPAGRPMNLAANRVPATATRPPANAPVRFNPNGERAAAPIPTQMAPAAGLAPTGLAPAGLAARNSAFPGPTSPDSALAVPAAPQSPNLQPGGNGLGVADAESRAVKSASSQLARLHANQPRPLAPPPAAAEALPPATTGASTARQVGAPRVPPRLSGRSVLEPAPSAAGSEPALELPPPMTDPASGSPKGPAGLPESSPAAPLRTPRKLPALDPQPLQQPRRELEIELEGFTEDSLSDETAGGQTPTEIQPVGYQQAAEFQSYASQQYAPQGDRPTATSVVEVPTQLVSPALRPSGMPAASGFQVEPVLGNAGSTPELELPPVDANEAWREADAVPHPEGTRVARGTAAGARPAVPAASANYIRPRRHAQDLPPVGGQTPEESLPPARSGLGNRLPPQDDFDQEYGPAMKSCEELRRELLGVTLRDISLDLSTPTSTIPADEAGYPIRDWRDPNNQVLLRGRAVAATMSEIRILDESGVERSLPLSQLGATDQKYAWDVMDLPFECNVVSDITYCRSFAPTHVSWHASNLCHKPLYFEDIQLERYGHTVGPIRQPVKSALRFLGQAALLPYQMSLAPPNECQYPLGLFRPGNCAPYLRTPFPWERRAVGYQAGVTAGLFLLVP